MHVTRRLGIALILAALSCVVSCRKKNTSEAQAPSGPLEPRKVTGNPFLGVALYWPPYNNADQARRRIEQAKPDEAALIGKIADTPQGRWLGEWSGNVEVAARNFTKSANDQGKVPLFIAYNIPNRDCGQHSAGGATQADEYRAWIRALASAITAEGRAIVVLEPDALGHLTQCLDEAAQAARLQLIRDAVETLEALPGVSVYIDAGHSRWVPAQQMAERLRGAGVGTARGFALNTSIYIADAELIAYGNEIVSYLGGNAHFIIDSSRNGNGPAPGDAWCNPPGRALGRPPAAIDDGSALDAFVWLKNPGESDGSCNGGPPAGQWFHELALELARNASW